jgi:hypothetical protein
VLCPVALRILLRSSLSKPHQRNKEEKEEAAAGRASSPASLVLRAGL